MSAARGAVNDPAIQQLLARAPHVSQDEVLAHPRFRGDGRKRLPVRTERQVDHLISRLCAVGFMEVLRSDEDRRVRILKPTERMLGHDRDWLAAHHAPLTVLCTDNDYGLVMQRDPAFQLLQRRTSLAFASLAFASLGLKLLLSEPDQMLFFDRAAGHMVLAALLHAA